MNDLRERYDFLFDGSGDLTQETLLLYVFGPLENGAREAVEQHLEDCEMCRDAAEGMALLGTKEQALASLAIADAKLLERVEELKQKVTSSGREELISQTIAAEPVLLRSEKRERRIGWYRYAVAASVLLVVGIAFWMVNQNMGHDKEAGISQNKQDSLGLLKERNSESPAAETTITSTLSATESEGTATQTDSGATAPYSYQWKDNAGTTNNGTPGTGSYTVTVTDANGAAMDDAPIAYKPQVPANKDMVQTDELEVSGEVVTMQPAPVVVNDQDKAIFEEKNKKEDAAGGFVYEDATVAKTTAPSLNKGTGNDNNNNNFLNNVYNTDVATEQAQYPGGHTEIQKYFDKLAYPSPIAKGYKGAITFEVSFDKKGNIKTATVVQGLGDPYDKLLLEHLNKMPAWEAPQPNGKPVESVRMVTVEVTVR